MSLELLPALVAPPPSHLDSLLPTQEGACLAKATLQRLVRAPALDRAAQCSVAPQPPPHQCHPLGLASVKLQVLGPVILVLCLVKQPVLVE